MKKLNSVLLEGVITSIVNKKEVFLSIGDKKETVRVVFQKPTEFECGLNLLIVGKLDRMPLDFFINCEHWEARK